MKHEMYDSLVARYGAKGRKLVRASCACLWKSGPNWHFVRRLTRLLPNTPVSAYPLYIGRNGKVVKLSPNKVRGLSRSNHHK